MLSTSNYVNCSMKQARKILFNESFEPHDQPNRLKWFRIIFESDTAGGRRFDVVLLYAIVLSVVVVMLDSVASIKNNFGAALRIAEWTFTLLFTAEYLIRLWTLKRPLSYAISLYGIIDVLAVIPSYLSLFLVGSQYLMVVRAIRLMRIFRILKLRQYLDESRMLVKAITQSFRKIAIFMMFIVILVTILGSVMYLVEGPQSGFTSIPESIYWAIVTLTTVGYGDISPATPLGKIIASIIMLCGYGIIAVPTGIVTSELTLQARRGVPENNCPECKQTAAPGANYCASCGTRLTRP